MYVSSGEKLPLGENTGSGSWDEHVGMADRGMLSERFDALWCEPTLGQPVANQLLRLPITPVLGPTGSSGPLAELELEWDSQQDRFFEPTHSNFNSNLDNGNLLPTALTYKEDDLVPIPYKEDDLVPVPISIVQTVPERAVEHRNGRAEVHSRKGKRERSSQKGEATAGRR
ncbi:hypothetical protein V6N11_018386 [Hibiscus sabdariffa]|uniref:Uncharacterized protein n=1 Tax=Hibiscus sabdariffa TaxID=183260 RepID=A0ABR2T858_9ROSI